MKEFVSLVAGGVNDLIFPEMFDRRELANRLQLDKPERLAKGKEVALDHPSEVARVVQASGSVVGFLLWGALSNARIRR